MKNKVVFGFKGLTKNENGTTTVITLLVMFLLMGFVALALTRSSSETIAVSNEISETKALFAAQASIENMALKADAKFENKLTLETSDVSAIQSSIPDGYGDYSFDQSVTKTKDAEVVDATGEQFQGLKSIRDEWQLISTATDKKTDVKVTLRRRFYNNRIPIFQFGTFYDVDMNFFNPAPFNFGGRVHSNANIFIQSSAGLYFSSKVTAVGQILTNRAPNGNTMSSSYSQNFVKDGSGVYKQLSYNEGSALASGSGPNLLASYPLRPEGYANPNWNTVKNRFNGNLLNEQKKLTLPLKGGYRDLIKRGKNIGDKFKNTLGSIVPVDNTTKDGAVHLKERYYNKPGIRISLASSKSELPGCATETGVCGVQLDNGTGYQPVAMYGGAKSARFNAGRFRVPGQQQWIKIEIVTRDDENPPITTDITEDILSLGLTERPEDSVKPTALGTNFQLDAAGYPANADNYAIVKLQRFLIPGNAIGSSSTYLNKFTISTTSYNYVLAQEKPAHSPALSPNLNPNIYLLTSDRFACHGTQNSVVVSLCTAGTTGYDNTDNQYTATVAGVTNRKVAPFPIMMFDTREGLPYDNVSGSGIPTPVYPTGRVPWSGVMSVVNIDVENLKLFLDGDTTLLNLLPRTGTKFSNAQSPNRALTNADISHNKGWVVYISDRRGDYDFDGEYDMEDLLANGTTPSTLNNGSQTNGEDPNLNGTFENDYTNEAARYNEYVAIDVAASANTRFFRRAIRMVNGSVLPGVYDSSVPANTKGLAIASENGVYVMGNYNSTGLSSSTGTPTPASSYAPNNTSKHIPASISADAITLLSNNWSDSRSFTSPFSPSGRTPTETTYRFAALLGNSRDWAPCVANQSQGTDRGFDCQSGGVHNLLRYIENWSSSVRSNYSGSLINLFYSTNANGVFKCCRTVYEPPIRNYVFDDSFLDINRIPPGSPFLQSVSLTGFERIND